MITHPHTGARTSEEGNQRCTQGSSPRPIEKLYRPKRPVARTIPFQTAGKAKIKKLYPSKRWKGKNRPHKKQAAENIAQRVRTTSLNRERNGQCKQHPRAERRSRRAILPPAASRTRSTLPRRPKPSYESCLRPACLHLGRRSAIAATVLP